MHFTATLIINSGFEVEVDIFSTQIGVSLPLPTMLTGALLYSAAAVGSFDVATQLQGRLVQQTSLEAQI